jgi:YfiH family protein
MLKKKHKNGVVYYQFSIFEPLDFVDHGFSTREGGVSTGVYKSMNLRIDSQDLEQSVEKNYQLFLEVFNNEFNNIYRSQQVHEDTIILIDDHNKDKKAYVSADGFVTAVEEIGLMTFHADCVPLFFVDPIKKVIGLVHSGWRGTYLKIAVKMINLLQDEFNSRVEDLMVGIGPAIGDCCYEVGSEVYDRFIQQSSNNKHFFTAQNHKYLMDLKGLNEEMLLSRGILEKNIEVSELCTKCNHTLFFSHRAHGNKRGVMAAYISKKRKA